MSAAHHEWIDDLLGGSAVLGGGAAILAGRALREKIVQIA